MGGLLRRGVLGMLCLALFALPAAASETITHTYDSLGRMVTTQRSGTVNNGDTAATTYDPAGNRTNQNVSNGPAFAIADASATEGGSLSFTVTVGAHTGTVSVTASTSNGSAVAPGDYTTKSQTLTFTSAQTSQTFSVSTTNDAVHESTEAMYVTLSSPSSGTIIADGSAVGTINDND